MHLKFDTNEEEKDFLKYHYVKSIGTSRVAMIVGWVLYLIFGVLDIWLVPISINKIWFIRFAIITPAGIVVFLLTFTRFYKKYMQIILAIASTFFGMGLVFIVFESNKMELGYHYYFIGIFLYLVWAHTLSRSFIKYSLVSTSIVILAYLYVAITSQRLMDDEPYLFLSNMFFLLGGNILGIFAGYTIERYMRKDFIQRRIIETEYNNLQKEIKMAKLIQQSILPERSVYQSKNIQVHYQYLPMVTIGGDFFDFKILGENQFSIILADVSGHGIPAALIVSMLKVSYDSSVHLGNRPDLILKKINKELFNITKDEFITVVCIYLDLKQKQCLLAQAGHPPVMVQDRESGTIQNYNSQTGPVGLDADFEFNTLELKLTDKQRLFLYTDGLIDSVKDIGGIKALEFTRSLVTKCKDLDAPEALEYILGNEKINTLKPADDITAIIIDILDLQV